MTNTKKGEMTKETKTSYTPGPWRFTENTRYVMGKDGTRVADMISSKGSGGETRKANAQLIAAAPDLLEAAKEALGRIESLELDDSDDLDFSPAYYKLIKVIAKAENREVG